MSDSPSHIPANLFRRLAALFYDSLLLLGITLGYMLVFGVWLPTWLYGPIPQGQLAYEGVAMWLFQLGWLALLVGFFVYFWRRGGQTLGMRAWHLRVQSRDGSRLSYSQCLLRCLLAPLSLAAFGLGYLWCLIDPHGQTLHDRLTHSEVIRVSSR